MSNYCLDDLPPYSINPCGELRVRGISDVALLKQGSVFNDPTDPAEWAAKIAAKELVIIKNVKGVYAPPEPENAPNPRERGPEEIMMKLNHSLVVTDANVNASNDIFYSKLNVQTFGGVVWHNPNEDELRVVYADVRVSATPATNTDGEFQTYTATMTWESNPDDFPLLFEPAPAGVFA